MHKTNLQMGLLFAALFLLGKGAHWLWEWLRN